VTNTTKTGDITLSNTKLGSTRAKELLGPALRFGSLIVLMAIFALVSDSFLTVSNILNILRQASVLSVLALGMTVVMINSGIDLAVGGIMTVAGCLCAVLMRDGMAIPLAMMIGLLAGAALGATSGLLVGHVGLPPFVATYGVLWISQGLALVLMKGQIIFALPAAFRVLGRGHIGFMPVIVVIAGITAFMVHLILTKTVFGQHVFAMGSNANAARYSGVKTRVMRILVFALSGTTAAIGGLLQTARLNAAEIAMGEPFLMLTIASVMIGGARRLGGEGGIGGTIVGALILTTVVNGMNLVGVPAEGHPLIIGLVVIGAVFLNKFMTRIGRV
jgi:ribose transport system permease protein